jgi:transposase
MAFLPARESTDSSPRYIGLDLHKKDIQMAVLDESGQQVLTRRFATTRENVLALAGEVLPTDTVAFEVGTNSVAVGRMLQASPARTILSNPIKTKVIAQAEIKTDKVDARVLAELARVGYLPQVWLPDPDTDALRHLFCDRRSLVDRRTELKNTVHSILHRNMVRYEFEDLFGVSGRAFLDELREASGSIELDSFDRLRLGAILLELDRLNESIFDVECVIAAFIVEREPLRRALDHLVSIPGVSLVVGAGFLAALGDISRFTSAKQVAKYFGLIPKIRESGDKKRTGRITKQGRSEARWLAVEAAEHLRKAPGPMRALYTRLAGKRGHNLAVVAVARKLAELAFHLLTRDEDFLYQKPRLTMEKRSRIRWMAKRRTGRKAKSASPRATGQAALYGSGLQGRKLKGEVARRAAEEAEAVYAAIVETRAQGESASTDADAFDPTRPSQPDWQRVLEAFARQAATEPETRAKTATRRSRAKAAAGTTTAPDA